MLTFIQNCLLSESDLVSFVTRHAVWFGRMSSPLRRNAFHCCHQFDVHLDNLIDVTPNFIYNFCNSKVDNDSFLLVNSLLELIFVRSGSYSLGGDCGLGRSGYDCSVVYCLYTAAEQSWPGRLCPRGLHLVRAILIEQTA